MDKHYNTDESQNDYAEGTKSGKTEYMLCGNAKYLQREKADQWWPGERGRCRREGLKSGGARWLKSHQ